MSVVRARLADVAPTLVGIATFVVALAVVEALTRVGAVNRFIVPMPSQIAMSFERIVVEEDVVGRFLVTSAEMAAAGVSLTVLGIAIGALLHRLPVLRQATETWVAALASAPIVLAYPLFMVVFGRSATTIVVIGVVAGLAPVILKTVEGLSGTRRVLIDVGRAFNLTPVQLFWKIMVPAALPVIFVGLRLGLVFALINIVGVEFLINFGGLGQLINELAERYDLPGTYAAIAFVILASVCFFAVIGWIERWLGPAR